MRREPHISRRGQDTQLTNFTIDWQAWGFLLTVPVFFPDRSEEAPPAWINFDLTRNPQTSPKSRGLLAKCHKWIYFKG